MEACPIAGMLYTVPDPACPSFQSSELVPVCTITAIN